MGVRGRVLDEGELDGDDGIEDDGGEDDIEVDGVGSGINVPPSIKLRSSE